MFVMKSPRYPLKIFYDGACPLCSREVKHYHRQDRDGRLLLVDISSPEFDPQPYGILLEAFMYELHAIDQEGVVYRGVDAFRAIWQAFPDLTTYRVMGSVLALPVVNSVARLGYRAFARLRPYLPGRRDACTEGTCRIGRERSKGDGL